jgi:hypothetical protein
MARLHPDVNLPQKLRTPRLDLSPTPKTLKGNNLHIIVRNDGVADSGPFTIIMFTTLGDGESTTYNSDSVPIGNVPARSTLDFVPSDGSKPKHFDTGTYHIAIFGGPLIYADHGLLACSQDLTGV